jgi:hypothetical protein
MIHDAGFGRAASGPLIRQAAKSAGGSGINLERGYQD